MNESDNIIADLQPLAIAIDELNIDPHNARAHDERNITAICKSLQKFKQRHPVVVQREGMVVRAGNGRVAAARRLGWTHVAAVVVDETAVEATAFAIADNRTAELATWDWPELAAQLADLNEKGFDVEELSLDFENLFQGNWEPAAEEGLDGEHKHTIVFSDEQWEAVSQALDRMSDLAGEKVLPGAAVVEFAMTWMAKE